MRNKIQEIKEMLNGCEVRTSKGVVGVNNGIATRNGEELTMTNRLWNSLWRSYVKEELG